MYKVNVNCKCIRNWVDMGLKIGMVLDGTVELDSTGDPTFIISHPGGKDIKCAKEWFEVYFELVE